MKDRMPCLKSPREVVKVLYSNSGIPMAPSSFCLLSQVCFMYLSVTPVFIAALFIIAKTWKQPKHPSTSERIKRCNIQIYIIKYYSAITKNEIMPFAAPSMKLEIAILSKVSQKEKDTWYHLYMESKV